MSAVSKILYSCAPTTAAITPATVIDTKIIDETTAYGSQLAGQSRMPEQSQPDVAA